MQITGNTILVTGGGSGIGRALAEAFQARGNRVVIAGRRRDALDAVTAANPGIASATLDIGDADDVARFAQQVTRDHPQLNAVVHNAGIMKNESLAKGGTDIAEAAVATNLLGPIRLTAGLLPHLLARPRATIMTVSSGLAFVPLSMTPSYCASKAAIHSWTQSLRYQLRDTRVQVQELVPPYVQTELMGARQANDPMAMPLADFIAEVMAIIEASPDAPEICVERVNMQRFADARGEYDVFYKKFNDTMTAARAGES